MVVATIDIGNTATKVVVVKANPDARRNRWQVATEHRLLGHNPQDVARLLSECIRDMKDAKSLNVNGDFNAVVVSSTVGYSDELRECLKSFGTVIYLDHNTPVPIKNLYSTPETLGPDRLAAAIGAHALCPDHDALIIDMGTAITYDYVTAEGEYLGGNIAPGIEMRFRALHDYTAKLPLITPPQPSPQGEGEEKFPVTGTSTQTAILNGVMQGVKHEVEGYIRMFLSKKCKSSVFLTGGDSINFDDTLKSHIFAHKYIVQEGLAEVFAYNSKQ